MSDKQQNQGSELLTFSLKIGARQRNQHLFLGNPTGIHLARVTVFCSRTYSSRPREILCLRPPLRFVSPQIGLRAI